MPPTAPGPTPRVIHTAQALVDEIAVVEALPPRQREAVVLKYVGDLDHRAVAAALGTSPAMSRRLVSDALATLRLDAEELR